MRSDFAGEKLLFTQAQRKANWETRTKNTECFTIQYEKKCFSRMNIKATGAGEFRRAGGEKEHRSAPEWRGATRINIGRVHIYIVGRVVAEELRPRRASSCACMWRKAEPHRREGGEGGAAAPSPPMSTARYALLSEYGLGYRSGIYRAPFSGPSLLCSLLYLSSSFALYNVLDDIRVWREAEFISKLRIPLSVRLHL